MCSPSVRSFLWHGGVAAVPLQPQVRGVQLDRRKLILHQGQQRELEHRGWGREVRPVVGRGPVPGPIRVVQDLRQRAPDAQRGLCR